MKRTLPLAKVVAMGNLGKRFINYPPWKKSD